MLIMRVKDFTVCMRPVALMAGPDGAHSFLMMMVMVFTLEPGSLAKVFGNIYLR